MMEIIKRAIDRIREASSYSKDNSDQFGEVFTPFELIDEMLDRLPQEVWSDKNKTFFDPCAGKGNFPIKVVERLFRGLSESIPDEQARLKHIVERQLFMGEYQAVSVSFIRELFKFDSNLKVNIYHGDTLIMPENYFDMSWSKREKILRDNPNGYEAPKPIDLFDIFS
jgi:type I restriction-modification system DNA methylase subunit